MVLRTSMLFSLVVLAFSGPTWGVGSAEGGVPWFTVQMQLINVALVALILYRFAGAGVVDFFAQRYRQFREAEEKTRLARTQAEEEAADLLARREKLESQWQESIARARAEAAAERLGTLSECQSQIRKMKVDAEQLMQFEADRLRTRLKNELLDQAVSKASDQWDPSELEQSHFVAEAVTQLECQESLG